MKQTIYKNGKKLRYGYTTGSCAAAATKAALLKLVTGKAYDEVDLMTPKGWLLKLSVTHMASSGQEAQSGVIKDSGDDPDITNGVQVLARVWFQDHDAIHGGLGVGTVTKAGLSVPIGESAINPVPRQMIRREVETIKSLYGVRQGVGVEISIPDGVELAKRTFNPRLGIMGGLSVLGTSGIVEPMSEEAFKDSLSMALKAWDGDCLAFVPGNYGRDHLLDQGVRAKYIFKTSNFIGFMFDRAVEYGIKKIVLVGHIGKLVKVAGGIFHTHSRVSDARMAILTAALVQINAPYSLLTRVQEANTTDEAVAMIYESGQSRVFQLIANQIKERLVQYVYEDLAIEVIMTSTHYGKLAETDHASSILERMYE